MPAPANDQARQLLIALLIALLKARTEGKQGADLIGAVAAGLTPKPDTAAGADGETLTPVNGALGEAIGKAIDGRKTGMGVVGLLATSILPVIFPDFASNLGMTGGVTGGQGGTVWGAIFSALTAWGVLGKTEKWVKDKS